MDPTIADVIAATARVTGIDAPDIYGRSRKRAIVWARHVAVVVADRLGFSRSSIGRALSRDHTTIIYTIRKMGKAEGIERQMINEAVGQVERAMK